MARCGHRSATFFADTQLDAYQQQWIELTQGNPA